MAKDRAAKKAQTESSSKDSSSSTPKEGSYKEEISKLSATPS